MSIEELIAVVAPPRQPVEIGDAVAWQRIQERLGIRLPDDLRELGMRYGSGVFDDGRVIIEVWNPFAPNYIHKVQDHCKDLRLIRVLPDSEDNIPYGVFPHQPGWLPFGRDMYGGLMCWLTEGEPEQWPILLLSRERTSFQQIALP